MPVERGMLVAGVKSGGGERKVVLSTGYSCGSSYGGGGGLRVGVFFFLGDRGGEGWGQC